MIFNFTKPSTKFDTMIQTEIHADKPITSSLSSKEQTILYLAARGCCPFGAKRVEQAYAVLQNLSLLLDRMEAEMARLRNNAKGRSGYKINNTDATDRLVADDVSTETDVDRIVASGSRLHRFCVDDVLAFFDENLDADHLGKLVNKEAGVAEAKTNDAPPRMIYTVPPPGLEIPEEYKRELVAKGIIESQFKGQVNN